MSFSPAGRRSRASKSRCRESEGKQKAAALSPRAYSEKRYLAIIWSDIPRFSSPKWLGMVCCLGHDATAELSRRREFPLAFQDALHGVQGHFLGLAGHVEDHRSRGIADNGNLAYAPHTFAEVRVNWNEHREVLVHFTLRDLHVYFHA